MLELRSRMTLSAFFSTDFSRSVLSMRIPFDLHVLSTPPAFVLSQDQTLKLNFFTGHPVRLT